MDCWGILHALTRLMFFGNSAWCTNWIKHTIFQPGGNLKMLLSESSVQNHSPCAAAAAAAVAALPAWTMVTDKKAVDQGEDSDQLAGDSHQFTVFCPEIHTKTPQLEVNFYWSKTDSQWKLPGIIFTVTVYHSFRCLKTVNIRGV